MNVSELVLKDVLSENDLVAIYDQTQGKHMAYKLSKLLQTGYGFTIKESPNVDATASIQTLMDGDNAFLIGTYKVDGTLNIQDGKTYDFSRAIFITPNGVVTFHANAVNDWELRSPKFQGAGKSASGAVGSAIGIKVTGSSNRYIIDAPRAKQFAGTLVKIEGATDLGSRGDQGRVINLNAFGCDKGFENTAGTSAEYCILQNPMISQCNHGMTISAGNTSVIGGNVVDNVKGLNLVQGANHGHGSVVGLNINHNADYNIQADSVVNGMSFNGCHIYGDTTLKGRIILNNSCGINFNGGIISARIVNNGAVGSLKNASNGVWLTGIGGLDGSNPTGFIFNYFL